MEIQVEFEWGIVEDVTEILRGSRLPKPVSFSQLSAFGLEIHTSRSASCSAGQSSNFLSFTQSVGEFYRTIRLWVGGSFSAGAFHRSKLLVYCRMLYDKIEF